MLGMEMRRLVVIGAGLLSLAAITGTASAADLAARPYTKAPEFVAPAYDWSGFYLGINAGGGWSHECYTITNVAGVPVGPASEGCHTANGGMVGGQLGYRWQSGGWVFGLEGQGDWANLKGSNSSLTAIIPYSNQTKVDAIGLITGQVGYSWTNVLWYVKGGAAVASDKYKSYFDATGVVIYQARETRWGGAVGTGLEVGFAPNWSVAFEYDHLFLGTRNIAFQPIAAVTRSDDIKQGIDMATVRVNYRFGGPLIAKY
jgi:outer membrane immunogenic protein